jgi:hypothetical protein
MPKNYKVTDYSYLLVLNNDNENDSNNNIKIQSADHLRPSKFQDLYTFQIIIY